MKINVILKKEAVDPKKITEQDHVVVLDILLATTTIVSLLQHRAKEIYPVIDKMEALSLCEELGNDSCLLIGEEKGRLIEGFLAPNPLSLQEAVCDKSIILSTTNGTVAIGRVNRAKQVYVACLLNGRAVARELVQERQEDENIHIVCSGSSNQFCMEDFYGAGFFIDELLQAYDGKKVELSDSALSAHLFYDKYRSQVEGERVLRQSSVGRMLIEQGFSEDISYVNQRNVYEVVPKLVGQKVKI